MANLAFHITNNNIFVYQDTRGIIINKKATYAPPGNIEEIKPLQNNKIIDQVSLEKMLEQAIVKANIRKHLLQKHNSTLVVPNAFEKNDIKTIKQHIKKYAKTNLHQISATQAATIGSDIPLENTYQIVITCTDNQFEVGLIHDGEAKEVHTELEAKNITDAVTKIIHSQSNDPTLKENGMILAGNTIPPTDQLQSIAKQCQMKIIIAPDPACCIIKGAGRAVQYKKY